MITNTLELREKYLRASMFPSIFCTACGIGNVLHYTIQAIDNVGLDITKTVFVSGIFHLRDDRRTVGSHDPTVCIYYNFTIRKCGASL